MTHRCWCAKGQYPGKKPVMFGTATLPLDAKDREIEEAFNALWATVSPHASPRWLGFFPGTLVFVEDKDLA